MSITFSTAWYVFKAKFDVSMYHLWIDHMLSNVREYNLVIYTDEHGYPYIEKYVGNPKIKVILKPYTEFYTYKYKDDWISNHKKNVLLRDRVDWKLNMLWSEKIHFVYQTAQERYFDSDFFGWCDIGYFRGNPTDLSYDVLRKWPNPRKIEELDKTRIYYACVNNNMNYIASLLSYINNKNSNGLPSIPIPPDQISIAGGFFVTHDSNLKWWRDTFDSKLALYFNNDYLVKDDQIVIADCVFSNLHRFELVTEKNPEYDNWFLFQRYLL